MHRNFSYRELKVITKYLKAIIADGDYMNDWITHLPENIQHLIIAIGKILAQLLGF